MRRIRWFVLGIGLAVATGAWAQEAPRPAVKVVVGAEGSVKVFDANTGKEIPAKVQKADGQSNSEKNVDQRRDPTKEEIEKEMERRLIEVLKEIEWSSQGRGTRVPLDEKAVARLLQEQLKDANSGPKRDADQKRRDEDQRRRDLEKARRDAEKALEDARREIESILKERQKDAKPEPKRAEKPKVIELELRDIIIDKDKRPGQSASVDQKLDLILKQMAELRRDVNDLKKKLEGQGSPGRQPGDGRDKKPGEFRFEFKPGADKKPDGSRFEFKWDEETMKQLHDMIRKKLESKAAPETPARQPDRNADIERRLERMIREAEELRREILKSKSPR
jgi:hypothetical protein